MRDRLRARRVDVVVAQVERAQHAAVVEELADGTRAAVADHVVRQVELLQARVVEDVADQHADLVVVHFAADELQHAQLLRFGEALREEEAVARRELEEVPLEVHAAVAHAVRHVEPLQVRQLLEERAELEVVHFGTVVLVGRVGVRHVVVDDARHVLDGRQQLSDLEMAHVGGRQRNRLVQLGRVGARRHEVLDDALQVALEVHPLPVGAVSRYVADRPARLAAPAPVAVVVDQVGRHLERQRRRDLLEQLGAVLRQQLVQHVGAVCNGHMAAFVLVDNSCDSINKRTCHK